MALSLNMDAKKTLPVTTTVNGVQVPVKPKPKWKKWLFWIFLILLIGGGFMAYRAIEFSNNVGIKFQPDDILNPIKKDPELTRDSTGKYTTALIVGIDTRSAKSDLQNTDSMIIATYNHENGNITMISVPRDLYVKIPNEGWYSKINSFYAHGESLKKGNGLNYLRNVLTSLTGIEIQYHALVDLQGFKKIVDAVGGVTVNVENSFTDYQYPAESKRKPVYETVTFKEGPQKMDGVTALKYARSRHSSDNNEGTDFARAKRQQKVISALKDKIVSTDTLLNPQKILSIMQAIQDNVKLSEVTNNDIQAGINMAKKYQEKPGKVYSFVLEPSFGGYQLLTTNVPYTNAYAIAPLAGIDNYTQVKELVQLCLTKPEIYSLTAKIRVYDTGIGYNEAVKKVTRMKKKYPYLDITFMGTLFPNKKGDVVYSHQNKFSTIANEFATYLKTENLTQPDYIKTNLNGEDVSILLGKPLVVDQANTE